MSKAAPSPGRNDPCPCGSGKKFKRCCGHTATPGTAPAASATTLAAREIGALVALVEQARLGEAEHRARSLLTTHPAVGMLWKILGVALLRQGKEALPALRRAAELLPQDAEAHANLGLALTDREQWTEALASLRRALAVTPRNPEVLVAAADACKALGQPLDAVALYRRALELEPRRIEARNNLGNALCELERFDEAAACYRLALEIEPSSAQIHCNLGNAQRHLGRLEEALSEGRRAIALDPALSVAHNHLGLVLAALGRREEAAASYRRALELDPRYAQAFNNLGNVQRDRGEPREAAALYARAIELDPRSAESHCSLGSVLIELRQIDAAVDSLRRALALDPAHALSHVSLAAALRQQGRAADAQASCRAALEHQPRLVEALALLGELEADRGRFVEAQQSFERAISIDPGFSVAYCSIAAHRRMTESDAAWLEGAEALLATRLARRHEIGLCYAVGKYFDDVRQYDRAFAHYRRANELAKGSRPSYDRTALAQRVDGMIGSFDANFLRRNFEHASTSRLPVFIVGMPRSGTSLAEQILASHPAVFGAGELSFWEGAYAAHQRAGQGSELAARLVPDMAERYLARLEALAGGAERVIDKMPANFLYAGLIHAVFPEARIIHMRRHPIDTCLSIYFQNFFNVGAYAHDLDHLAHYYGQYVRLTDHWRRVLPASGFLEVPYEALIEDPEGWTRRLLDFVGLPWDRRCLDFHRTDRVVITASKWQVRQPIHRGSAGRWRHYEKHVGPLLSLI